LSQLNDLAVEDEEEDGKWLNLFNYSDMTSDMYLLAGNHTLAVDNNKLDEGRLYNPSLYRIDQTTGQKEALITNLEGLIERVSNGWLSKEPELGVSEVFGHINVISDEIIQTGGSKLITESSLVTYLLEQTFENSSSLTPDFIKAPKVAERHF
jgi:hypothetical protein